MIIKPALGTYPEYYQPYVDMVSDGLDVLNLLAENYFETEEFMYDLPSKKLDYSYAEGKWTIKEIIQHLTDCERVFAYRALRIARFDETPLPGFDENMYSLKSFAKNRNLESLLEEFKAVRDSTLALFENLDKSVFENKGTSNGFPIVLNAIPFIIAGHEMHHMKVIQEKYI